MPPRLISPVFPMLAAGLFLCLSGCMSSQEEEISEPSVDYRREMRDFVLAISREARSADPDFIVIPQNGQELVTSDGTATGTVEADYLGGIDGTGREDLYYGYNDDDLATPGEETAYMKGLCDIFLSGGKTVLVIDYCSTPSRIDDSIEQNELSGYISYAADHRNLDNIPAYPTQPGGVNANNISLLAQAKNFLYLINPENYADREGMISALEETDYDLLVLDLFVNEESLTGSDLDRLKVKNNGASRRVVCYMSIGEAEDYRYYWQSGWNRNKPEWLERENPDWPGNYKVRYWEKEWQDIICGKENSYLTRIREAGFDGVYLDIIDAFEYFENE